MISRLVRLARHFFPKRQRRVAIAAILKNEGPYLLEWIAFHRVIGIEQFFIADNVSDDGTTELLIALDKIGIVNRLPFPNLPGQPPQLRAYAKLMKRYRRKADWIALIDCDEFLTPTDGAVTIHELLASIEADPKVGTIRLNWAMFGSSGSVMPTNEPVIARFSMHSAKNYEPNHHYKALVRSKAFVRPSLSPHDVILRRGFRAIHADGRELALHEKCLGLSAEVVWDRMRLNHYFVKSKGEFRLIKLPRGRSDIPERRSESEFEGNDHNQVSGPMPEWLVIATKNEMDNIRETLRNAGCSEELVTMDKKLVERIALLRQEQNR